MQIDEAETRRRMAKRGKMNLENLIQVSAGHFVTADAISASTERNEASPLMQEDDNDVGATRNGTSQGISESTLPNENHLGHGQRQLNREGTAGGISLRSWSGSQEDDGHYGHDEESPAGPYGLDPL